MVCDHWHPHADFAPITLKRPCGEAALTLGQALARWEEGADLRETSNPKMRFPIYGGGRRRR